ncbi:MAG: NAD-dependent epimerase/dehydratase family protein [Myxococcota bacterium]
MTTILVTGAAGTVGNYVVSLAEAAGHRVIASDINAAAVRVPVRGEVRPADLTDRAALPGLVRGCEAVIHTAARLDVEAESAELAKVNTDAVVHLYQASQAAGVRRFVHMSDATLYASSPDPVREDAPLAPRGRYGMSKHAAEVFFRGEGAAGLPWTILRAAAVYGRRGRHFAASLLAVGPILRMATPVLPRFAGGPSHDMVHAEDVARALLFVLDRQEAAYQVFNVSDGDTMPLGDRITATFEAYGLRTFGAGRAPQATLSTLGRLCQLPGPYHAADAAALAAWRLLVVRHGLRPALRPRMDRESLPLLYEDLVVDASKLRELGWEPRFSSFEQGWREVLRWYQAERWVPRYG